MKITENFSYRGTRMAVLAIAAVFIVSLTSCDVSKLSDTVDDFGVVIGLEPINTNSTVLLTDAATGELVSSKVTVLFDGQNGQDVIDMYSDPMPSETVNSGILNFGIDNSVVPTESSPVHVQLKFEAPGYLPVTKTAVISAEGKNEFAFELVKESNPPASVTTTSVQASTNSDGSVATDIEVASETNDDGESGVSANIPSGTVFADSLGNPLTGQLTTQLTNFDPSDPASLQAFPFDIEVDPDSATELGGISLISVVDENGTLADSTITPAEKNKFGEITNHSQSTFTYYLPSWYANPGDELVFTTYTYYWYRSWWGGWYRSYRSNYYRVPVQDMGNGRVGVRVAVNQWPNGICVYRIIRAERNSTLAIDRNGRTGTIYGYAYAYGSYRSFRLTSSQSSVVLPRVFNRDYRVQIYSPLYHYAGTYNLYNQNSVNITLPAPPPEEIDATISVTATCRNPNEKVSVTDIPGASVVYRKSDAATGTRWKVAKNLQWDYDDENQELSGGSFDVEQVEDGANYTFKITYDGNELSRSIQITGPEVTYTEQLKDNVCS